MVGCSQQSVAASHESAKKQDNTQPEVKVVTKVNTYVYDSPDPLANAGRVYICGTITNQSKVPIVIKNVTLHSESIYGEEIDTYTYTNANSTPTDVGDSVSGVYPIVVMPGESAYLSRDTGLKHLNKKEEFKKTTMEVNAVPVDPANAKELRSLVTVSNVKTKSDTQYNEMAQRNENSLTVYFQATNNANHHIDKIDGGIVLFDKTGNAIGVASLGTYLYSMNAKEIRDNSTDPNVTGVSNMTGFSVYDDPNELDNNDYIPTNLLKQIDHVKVITVTEDEENLASNASSNDNGDVN